MNRVHVGLTSTSRAEQQEALFGQVLLPIALGLVRIGVRKSSGPTKQVSQRDETILAQEEATRLRSLRLQLGHGLDQQLSVGARQLTPHLDDVQELGFGQVLEVQLDETIAKSARELLATGVLASRILGGKEEKARMSAHELLGFGNVQLAIVVKHSIERLEHFARCQIQLVQQDPVAFSHRLYEMALLKSETRCRRVDHVRANVLGQVRVVVVVDTHKFIACRFG